MKITLMGNPTMPSWNGQQLSNLSGAENEIKEIENILSTKYEIKSFIKEQARKRKLFFLL